MEQVSKRYGGLVALDRLTASIRPGAVGLLGPNGAGKSTLIKLLLGLVRFTSGSAKVFDLDVRTQSRRIRELVGYMPEDDCYVAGLRGVASVAYAGELAGLPPLTALRRAHEMLDYVLIGEERYRWVQTYSTGMKQKIKLAQALIHSPKLVFLDEPTSGLDPQGREKMLQLVRNLATRKGVSVVVSTHILTDVEACCDAVLMVGSGKLLVYDTLEALRRTAQESCRVRFDGDRRAFLAALAAEGCRAEQPDADELHVQGPAGRTADLIFRSAHASQTALRQVVPFRNSLEDIFLKAVHEAPPGEANHAHL
ncbi:MAG TPA: ABC transporter ATP-binding protein [Pirellulales bacterium]|nr:ABC transporter ATP-binding protein [Pirellulales bacterium]